MAITYVIPSNDASSTVRYPFGDKRDQAQRGERVLWSDSFGCSVNGAARSFEQVRRLHDKRGYRHHLQDAQGQRTGEVDYMEALHVIVSMDTDELAPDDPEAWEKCGTLAREVAMRQFPGYQWVLGVQADGDSGKLHAHLVLNTVAFRDAEIDGHHRRAGRLMGGQVTKIENIRATVDGVSKELGIRQKLPTYVKDVPVARTVSRTDRQIARRGGKSDRDVARDLLDDLVHEGVAVDELPARMAEHGWAMEFTQRASGTNKGEPVVKIKNTTREGARSVVADGKGRSSDLGTDYTRVGLEARVLERQRELAAIEREERVLDEFEAAVAAFEAEKAAHAVPSVVKRLQTESEPQNDLMAQMRAQVLGGIEERVAATDKGVEQRIAHLKESKVERDADLENPARTHRTPEPAPVVAVEAPEVVPEAVEPSQAVETAPEPVEAVQEPAIVETEPVDVVANHLAGLRETIDAHQAWLDEHDAEYRKKLASTATLRANDIPIDPATQELFDEFESRRDVLTDMREDVVELETIVAEHGSTSDEAVAAITSDAVEGRMRARQARRLTKLTRLQAVLAAHQHVVEAADARRVVEQMSRDAIER